MRVPIRQGGTTLQLQSGLGLRTLRVAGSVAAPGAPLALVDLAGAQALFGRLGRLDRIHLRLAAGTDATKLAADWALPPEVRAVPPGEAEQRLSNVSRAYRVNLTVLALVALFTGTFLVFSILSLSVAQRLPQLALLGVLGLEARDRQALVLAESALIGLLGSALGVAPGASLALQSGLLRTLRVAGSVTAPGGPLALVVLAGAQALVGAAAERRGRPPRGPRSPRRG